jgi:hypothetical protein
MFGGHTQREPGLAHPGGTGQRDQAVGIEQRDECGGLTLAADEAGEWDGHRVGARGATQIHSHLDQRGPIRGTDLTE